MYTQKRTVTQELDEKLLRRRISLSRHFGQPFLYVVTKVQYGANSFLSFDLNMQKESRKKEVAGWLEVFVKSIPGIHLEGKGHIKVDDWLETRRGELDYSYRGERTLTSLPTSLEEAVRTAQMVANWPLDEDKDGWPDDIGVPLAVTLEPLCKWETDAIAKIMRQITGATVQEVADVMDSWREAKQNMEGLILDAQELALNRIQSRTASFKRELALFEPEIVTRIAAVLPTIRGGDAEEVELLNIIKEVRNSPFAPSVIARWVQQVQDEIDYIQQQHKNILEATRDSGTDDWKGCRVQFETASTLAGPTLLGSPSVNTVLVFALVRGGTSPIDSFDYELDLWVKAKKKIPFRPTNVESWFKMKDTIMRIRAATTNFIDAATHQGCDSGMRFVFTDYASDPSSFSRLGVTPLEATALIAFHEAKVIDQDWRPGYLLYSSGSQAALIPTGQTGMRAAVGVDASRVSSRRPGSFVNGGIGSVFVELISDPKDMSKNVAATARNPRGVQFTVKNGPGTTMAMIQFVQQSGATGPHSAADPAHGIALTAEGNIWIQGSGDDDSVLDVPEALLPLCNADHEELVRPSTRAGDATSAPATCPEGSYTDYWIGCHGIDNTFKRNYGCVPEKVALLNSLPGVHGIRCGECTGDFYVTGSRENCNYVANALAEHIGQPQGAIICYAKGCNKAGGYGWALQSSSYNECGAFAVKIMAKAGWCYKTSTTTTETTTSSVATVRTCRAHKSQTLWEAGDAVSMFITPDDAVWFAVNGRIIKTGAAMTNTKSVVLKLWLFGPSAEVGEMQLLSYADAEALTEAAITHRFAPGMSVAVTFPSIRDEAVIVDNVNCYNNRDKCNLLQVSTNATLDQESFCRLGQDSNWVFDDDAVTTFEGTTTSTSILNGHYEWMPGFVDSSRTRPVFRKSSTLDGPELYLYFQPSTIVTPRWVIGDKLNANSGQVYAISSDSTLHPALTAEWTTRSGWRSPHDKSAFHSDCDRPSGSTSSYDDKKSDEEVWKDFSMTEWGLNPNEVMHYFFDDFNVCGTQSRPMHIRVTTATSVTTSTATTTTVMLTTTTVTTVETVTSTKTTTSATELTTEESTVPTTPATTEITTTPPHCTGVVDDPACEVLSTAGLMVAGACSDQYKTLCPAFCDVCTTTATRTSNAATAVTAVVTTDTSSTSNATATTVNKKTTTTILCNGKADADGCDGLTFCALDNILGEILRRTCPILCETCAPATITVSATKIQTNTTAGPSSTDVCAGTKLQDADEQCWCGGSCHTCSVVVNGVGKWKMESCSLCKSHRYLLDGQCVTESSCSTAGGTVSGKGAFGRRCVAQTAPATTADTATRFTTPTTTTPPTTTAISTTTTTAVRTH